MVLLKISEKEFEKVNNLIVEKYPVNLKQLNEDYYLFQFTNEELLNVIHKPNEWNFFDRAIAREILKNRNVEITDQTIHNSVIHFTSLRIEKSWLIVEYLATLLFWFVGIFIGIITTSAKKTLANGKTVNIYDGYSRNHGYVMLGIGLLRLIIFLFLTING